MTTATGDGVLDVLRGIDHFGPVPTPLLAAFAAEATEVRYAAGESLWDRGRGGQVVQVLLAGRVRWSQTIGGERIVLAVHEPVTYFGAISALTQDPPRVDADALDAAEVVTFPAAAFRRLCMSDEGLLARTVKLMGEVASGNEALLRQRERLASVGTLAAGLAHEINNPAAAAQGAVEALRGAVGVLRATTGAPAPRRTAPRGDALAAADAEETLAGCLANAGVEHPWAVAATLADAGVDPEWVRDVDPAALPAAAASAQAEALLDDLGGALGRITRMTGVISDYSNLDRAPEADVDVAAGLRATLVMLGPRLRETGTTLTVSAADLAPVVAHPSELNQVWTSLIDNAIDAAPGGEVLVTAAPGPAGGVRVQVADAGPGIAPEDQTRVFEAFYSTKDGHSGLGLEMARRIVENRHRGRILIGSQPGETVVTVDLPAA